MEYFSRCRNFRRICLLVILGTFLRLLFGLDGLYAAYMYMLHYINEPMDGKASSACESLGNVMEKGWDLGTFYAFGCEIMFSVNNV